MTDLERCIKGLQILAKYDTDGTAMVIGHSDSVHVNLLHSDDNIHFQVKDIEELNTLGWVHDYAGNYLEESDNCWVFLDPPEVPKVDTTEKKEPERQSTITPEEVDEILECSFEDTKELEPALRKVFRRPPRNIILD